MRWACVGWSIARYSVGELENSIRVKLDNGVRCEYCGPVPIGGVLIRGGAEVLVDCYGAVDVLNCGGGGGPVEGVPSQDSRLASWQIACVKSWTMELDANMVARCQLVVC